ncbi:helix-turn-helix domain-containing protein [Oceanibacterium hippocampi]|uniref:HTH cro/C1-type domain-containing protein n=1 Tax=Oceanibacterium hippocampi TaxID=745714 RepID=A0A1Y5U1N2_9PROT|nr:helix-turn-helix transcriptional regulator [Oceanibacterium hippocampi]SLN76401.1 hypothetical protein OCH7691_04121 [Oceanibacterium hippocampi]
MTTTKKPARLSATLTAEEQADLKRRKRAAGQFLRATRNNADLTQREMGVKIGFNYYTMVGSVESGATRLPGAHWAAWADAVGIDRAELAEQLLKEYEPEIYLCLKAKRRALWK